MERRIHEFTPAENQPVAVVFKLVVAGHGQKTAETNTQRIEDLCGCVSPSLKLDCYQIKETSPTSVVNWYKHSYAGTFKTPAIYIFISTTYMKSTYFKICNHYFNGPVSSKPLRTNQSLITCDVSLTSPCQRIVAVVNEVSHLHVCQLFPFGHDVEQDSFHVAIQSKASHQQHRQDNVRECSRKIYDLSQAPEPHTSKLSKVCK